MVACYLGKRDRCHKWCAKRAVECVLFARDPDLNYDGQRRPTDVWEGRIIALAALPLLTNGSWGP